MQNRFIAVLVVFAVLLAAAVVFVIYMETHSEAPAESGIETTAADSENPEITQPEEETTNFSMPTEDSDEILPMETVSEADEIPAVTADPDATQETESREDNELELDRI